MEDKLKKKVETTAIRHYSTVREKVKDFNKTITGEEKLKKDKEI